jgi:hypothetical protein
MGQVLPPDGEFVFEEGSAKEIQKKLNQWKNLYTLVILQTSFKEALAGLIIRILLYRTPKPSPASPIKAGESRDMRPTSVRQPVMANQDDDEPPF